MGIFGNILSKLGFGDDKKDVTVESAAVGSLVTPAEAIPDAAPAPIAQRQSTTASAADGLSR